MCLFIKFVFQTKIVILTEQKIFNWINDKVKNVTFEEDIYIEMPERQKIEEGEENEREQGKSGEDDKI